MARLPRLTTQPATVILRVAKQEALRLFPLLFSRYPRKEWASFLRLGWRETSEGLVLTAHSLIEPRDGDLDPHVGNVSFQEAYSLRVAIDAEQSDLGIGLIHSHPKECAPLPSTIDDDMDRYYAEYFSGFAPGRPFGSFIASIVDGELSISGRVCWKSRWLSLERACVEERAVVSWSDGEGPPSSFTTSSRRARLAAAWGKQAEERLQRSTVAVIGAGGTGSAAIEVLARAGVGHLIVVDPDHIEHSNLERVHGSRPEHAAGAVKKVAVAREHVSSIAPECRVTGIVGSLPHPTVIDLVLQADAILGCTDQQHSRLALSDLAVRYLVPVLDVGVAMESKPERVTGQIVQLLRFQSHYACLLCRGSIDGARLAQELMSPVEREQRQRAAADAEQRGDNPDPYWRSAPQLNTVGYLTTMSGALAAGYIIGWLTERFTAPFEAVQMNLIAPGFDVVDIPEKFQDGCACRRARGRAEQAAAEAFISAPSHWPDPIILN